MTPSNITIRDATMADAEGIRAIYNAEVSGSTVTFDLTERSLDDQKRWLGEHLGAYPALVAGTDDGRIAGFASATPYRDRPAYRTTVEDSVYVHRDFRGLGLGLVLLVALVDRCSERGFHSMIARVVGGHAASVDLHQKVGFEVIGTEREVGRKFGRWLDVVSMQRLL